MCVNNLPGVTLDSGTAEIRTCNLLIASPAPYHYATKPIKNPKVIVSGDIVLFM